MVADVMVALAKNGEPKGNWNFWVSLIATCIEAFILYKAGCFDLIN
jgi:hypothetical protein